MNTKLSFQNIQHLIRYDWKFNQKAFLLKFGMIELILIAVIVLQVGFKGVTTLGINSIDASWMGEHILNNSTLILLVMNIATVILMTRMMHTKINKGNNSIPYVMLPANNVEKVTTIHIWYFVGMIFSIVIYVFNIFFLGSIFTLIVPGTMESILTSIQSFFSDIHLIGYEKNGGLFLWAFLSYTIINTLLIYILYLNINLFFKKNPQVKSNIVLIFLGFGYLWYTTKVIVPFKENIQLCINRWEVIAYPLLFLIPVIGLFYALYYQIREKEIK